MTIKGSSFYFRRIEQGKGLIFMAKPSRRQCQQYINGKWIGIESQYMIENLSISTSLTSSRNLMAVTYVLYISR
jgi:hypothetical protein